MIEILCVEFGPWADHAATLTSQARPNGWGKTSLLNAYRFALTGRAPSGFEVRRVGAPASRQTSVTVRGFADATLRRVYDEGRTTLYVDGDVTTQKAFEQFLNERGIPIELVEACADTGVLASPDLKAEQVRVLLSRAGVIESSAVDELRRRRLALLSDCRRAEAAAAITLPPEAPPQCPEPTEAERLFERRYEAEARDAASKPQSHCPACGHALSGAEIRRNLERYKRAVMFVCDKATNAEIERIRAKNEAYTQEQEQRRAAQLVRTRAATARADYQRLRAEIVRVEQQITEALGPQPLALPEGVALDVTERGTYQITVGGVPLRSVNHAQRVALSVEMLAKARAAAGADDLVPIIVDNAESVQNTFEQWPNIIRFSVLQ